MLVTFEGGDGVGKTTQAHLLVKYLESQKVKCQYLKYPDRSTHSGQIIDEYLKGRVSFGCHTINLILMANLWELADEIERLLEKGAIVIMDRYVDTNTMYSMVRGCSLEETTHPAIGLPRPDMTFFLDLDPKAAMQRKTGSLEVLENETFQSKVYQNYKLIMKPTWIHLDASKTVDEIGGAISASFERHRQGV